MLCRQELVEHRTEVLRAWEKVAEGVEEGLRKSKWQETVTIWWLAGVEGFLGLSFAVFLALYLSQSRDFRRFAAAIEETVRKLGLSEGGTGGKLGQLVTLLNTRLEKLHEVAGKLLDKAQHLRGAVEQLAEGAEETAEAVMKATWAALKATSTVEAVSTGTAALSDATAATARQLSEGAEKLQVVLDEVANLKLTLGGGHAALQRLEKTVGAEGRPELADFRRELSGLIALLDPENGASGEMVRRISESLISCRDTLAVVQQFGEELKGLIQNILDLKEQVVNLGIMAEQHTAMVEEVASSIYVLSKMAGELEELATWLKEGRPAVAKSGGDLPS
jgi:methyl-accepting chemotaxis protein